MNIADTRSEKIDSQRCDTSAFDGVGAFARIDNTVFFAADRADFGFDGNAFRMRFFDDVARFCDVFIDRIFRTVEHNG